ncbi:MAG: glucose-1-phosphate adenylyltransferase subunit GlgD [Faecousia sp.]
MNVMGLVFANIYDSSLGELTNKRTMASLPYGGRYRQIDFTLSNMANAGIGHIGIITKYNYQSLMNHIGSAEEWDLELGENGLEFLTPFSMGHTGSYRGKLEAIHSAMSYLQLSTEEYVILADAGVLCAIDLGAVLQAHIDSGKDVTVVAKAGVCNGERQTDLAVEVNGRGEVVDMAVDYRAPEANLASMGIFVMKRELLMKAAEEAVARNRYRFERDFLLSAWQKGEISVNVYAFQNVALFNESTEEFYQNNLALLDENIRKSLFRDGLTIYTKVRDQVPSYYGEDSQVDNCVVADGCILQGNAEHSVLFRGVKIGKNARVKDCVIMANCIIGDDADLECCILDKDVKVSAGSRLAGTPQHPFILKRGDSV